MKRDELYLCHILQAIVDIRGHLNGIKDFQDFSGNLLVQDAVMRKLEIIGEAAKRITLARRADFSGIPWKDVCGMRDKLVHDYFGVDLKAVWKTVTEDIELMKSILRSGMMGESDKR